MPISTWEDHRPQPGEYDDYYRGYINLVGSNVVRQLIRGGQQTCALIQQLTPDEADRRYAEGKWSVKEVLGHVIDTERIMAYRALCISRGDQTPLPGYDDEEYVEKAGFGDRSIQNLSAEYDALRNANTAFFNGLTEEQTLRTGTASGFPVSVRALAYIIAGHERHHLNVLEEKYGIDVGSRD